MESKQYNQTVITYNWELSPIEEEIYDYVIVISLHRKLSSGEEKKKQECIWCKFPSATYPVSFSDVSGTLGLLWAMDNKAWIDINKSGSDNNGSIFERTLADIIMKFISSFELDENIIELICIQGPLLPKLRGRIMYRSFPENVYIFATTYNELWFQRISSIMTFEEEDDIYPPLALDHTTRMWFHSPELGGKKYHVELISNSWDTSNEKDKNWLSIGIENIKDFLQNDLMASKKEEAGFPRILAYAIQNSNRIAAYIKLLNTPFSLSRKAKDYLPEKTFKNLNNKSIKGIIDEIFDFEKQNTHISKTKEGKVINMEMSNANEADNIKGLLVSKQASHGSRITHSDFFEKAQKHIHSKLSSS